MKMASLFIFNDTAENILSEELDDEDKIKRMTNKILKKWRVKLKHNKLLKFLEKLKI